MNKKFTGKKRGRPPGSKNKNPSRKRSKKSSSAARDPLDTAAECGTIVPPRPVPLPNLPEAIKIATYVLTLEESTSSGGDGR